MKIIQNDYYFFYLCKDLNPNESSFVQQIHICGVIVSVFALNVVDRGFGPRSGQTKDYKVVICCFSAVSAMAVILDLRSALKL